MWQLWHKQQRHRHSKAQSFKRTCDTPGLFICQFWPTAQMTYLIPAESLMDLSLINVRMNCHHYLMGHIVFPVCVCPMGAANRVRKSLETYIFWFPLRETVEEAHQGKDKSKQNTSSCCTHPVFLTGLTVCRGIDWCCWCTATVFCQLSSFPQCACVF